MILIIKRKNVWRWKWHGSPGRTTWSLCSKQSYACYHLVFLCLWTIAVSCWGIVYSLSWWSHFCKQFLNRLKFTILVVEVGIIFFFIDNLHLLSHILRVGVAEKVAVSCSAKPVIASLKLVLKIFIIVSFSLLFHKIIRVSAFAPQWEISTSMPVSFFDILVISSITWELWRVGT